MSTIDPVVPSASPSPLVPTSPSGVGTSPLLDHIGEIVATHGSLISDIAHGLDDVRSSVGQLVTDVEHIRQNGPAPVLRDLWRIDSVVIALVTIASTVVALLPPTDATGRIVSGIIATVSVVALRAGAYLQVVSGGAAPRA